MAVKTAVKKRQRPNPNLGLELDKALNELITRETMLIPSKSKSMVVRERLRQSYIDYPLPGEQTA